MIRSAKSQSETGGLFVFGGALVSSIMIVSIIAHNFDHVWESHAIASRQWLASLLIFICFLAPSLFPSETWRFIRQAGSRLTRQLLESIYSNTALKSSAICCFALCVAALPVALVAGIVLNANTLLARCILSITIVAISGGAISMLQWPSAAMSLRRGVVNAVRSSILGIGDRDRFKIAFYLTPLLLGLAIVTLAAPTTISTSLEAVAALLAATYFVRRLSAKSHKPLDVLQAVSELLLTLALMGTVAWLAYDSKRSIALAFALLQVVLFSRLIGISMTDVRKWAPLLFASIIGWVFSVTFSFTPLANSILSASESTATSVVALVVAFGIVIVELTRGSGAQKRTSSGNTMIWIFAILTFIELGLRTDSFLADWIPYHRSYWVGPADFVRAGGWLLWDIPAQYGFLSALSLAIWPAASTWQALYEQTAFTLVFDGLILFWMLREQRTGVLNATFALLVTVATLFSSEGARTPFGWRLYPQAGLRFTGVIALIAVSYGIYRSSGDRHKIRALYLLGFAIWILSIAWSLESGILASIFWVAFVYADYLYGFLVNRTTARSLISGAITRLLPFVCLPVLFVAVVDIYYWSKLGHGPDWTSFFEFSFAFQAEQVELRQIVSTGPGWVLVSVLIGVGFEAVRAARLRLPYAPLVCALWFGVWGLCSYYVGEGFNNHINVLSPLLALAVAVILAVRRAESSTEEPPLATYSLFAPLLILCIGQAFADPVEIAAIKAPLMPGYSFDSIAGFDRNSSEIKRLELEAGVKPGDRIIYPDSNWRVKLDLGLNMPFIINQSGRTIQQVAWLPVSPVGPFDMLMTLPYERRALYLTRYFSQVHDTGWLLSYHQAVDCKRYIPSLETRDVHRSLDYEIGRCVDPSGGVFAGHNSH